MKHRLRLVFMGTPDFAAAALQALVASGHEIAAVYSQPPRPAGRGQALRKSPVQVLADVVTDLGELVRGHRGIGDRTLPEIGLQ